MQFVPKRTNKGVKNENCTDTRQTYYKQEKLAEVATKVVRRQRQAHIHYV